MYEYPRIRDIREDNDLKQSTIAQLLGITTQQYSLYETGKREIPLHHIIKLANYYNISLDYLVGISRKPKPISK